MNWSYDETITEGWRALELFTDRVEARRRYCSYLNDDPCPSSVLVFHGDGGNGKSLLMQDLRENLSKRIAKDNWEYLKSFEEEECLTQIVNAADVTEIPIGRLDFAAGRIEGYDALLELRRDLSGPKLQFPLFDFGIVTYLRKSRQLTREHLRTVFPADELDFILDLVELSTEVPGVGLFIKFADLVDRRFGSTFRFRLQQRGLRDVDILAIQRKDYKSELLQALPELFAHDINAALADPAGPERIVLFFDTHENFWGHERNIEGDRYFGRDEWLRRLVCSLDRSDGAVVVVAGREVPRWAEAKRFPVTDLECLSIGELKDADARSFLNRAGVTDPALYTRLLEDARVGLDQIHPYYLGLGADLVLVADDDEETLLEKDLELSQGLASQERKLVDRLLRYVDSGLRDAVAAISAGRWFDWDLFEYLGGELGFSRERATFRMLTAFSFVRRMEGGTGRYRIHDLLRRLALDEDRERIRLEAHMALETYFRTGTASGDDLALAEAIYHGNRIEWERGVREWVEEFNSARRQSQFSRCRALLGIRNELIIEMPIWDGHVSAAVSDYFATLSQYPDARAEHSEAISAYNRALATDALEAHNSRGIALQSMGNLYAQQGQSSEAETIFRESIEAFNQALALSPNAPEFHNNRGISLRCLGDLHSQFSQSDEALASYQESIGAFDYVLNLSRDDPRVHSNRGVALQSLGDLQVRLSQPATALGNYRRGIAALEYALTLSPMDSRIHTSLGIALQSLGDLQIRLNQPAAAHTSYQQSINAFEQSLVIAPEAPRTHSSQGVVMQSLGNLQAQLGQFQYAEKSYRKSIAAFARVLALSPNAPEVHNNLGNVLQSQGNLQAQLDQNLYAEQSYYESIAAFSHARTLAPDAPEVHNNLGNTLRCLGDLQARLRSTDKAAESYRESIAAFTRARFLAADAPEIHSNLGLALQSLGNLQAKSGHNHEAEQNYRSSIAAFSHALALAPNSITSLRGRADASLCLLQFIPTGESVAESARPLLHAVAADLEYLLLLIPDDLAARDIHHHILKALAELIDGGD